MCLCFWDTVWHSRVYSAVDRQPHLARITSIASYSNQSVISLDTYPPLTPILITSRTTACHALLTPARYFLGDSTYALEMLGLVHLHAISWQSQPNVSKKSSICTCMNQLMDVVVDKEHLDLDFLPFLPICKSLPLSVCLTSAFGALPLSSLTLLKSNKAYFVVECSNRTISRGLAWHGSPILLLATHPVSIINPRTVTPSSLQSPDINVLELMSVDPT